MSENGNGNVLAYKVEELIEKSKEFEKRFEAGYERMNKIELDNVLIENRIVERLSKRMYLVVGLFTVTNIILTVILR